MSHAFKFCFIVIAALLGMQERVLAQCFVCSDSNQNTAVGAYALYGNSTGANNTAAGTNALYFNTTGNGNTATGYEALYKTTTGSYNTAMGYESFLGNTSGSYTTAVGAYSLAVNTTGGYDTAFGAYSLPANTTGTGNTAFGYAGLRSNTTGNNNIGFGYQSLYSNATGSNNIAMGYQAAYYVTDGSNNIELGNMGGAADNNLIRIGSAQSATYIAGITGATVTGSAVYVTASGQLGVLASSERYKTAIASMGGSTENLQQLRPVTFHLKTDPKGIVQYGLIAEEVAKVYPELVIRDAAGKIQGVRYEELAPMLLNEVQQQQKQLREMRQELAELKELNRATQAALVDLRRTDGAVAKR
jgi:Chaperone of endosialidase